MLTSSPTSCQYWFRNIYLAVSNSYLAFVACGCHQFIAHAKSFEKAILLPTWYVQVYICLRVYGISGFFGKKIALLMRLYLIEILEKKSESMCNLILQCKLLDECFLLESARFCWTWLCLFLQNSWNWIVCINVFKRLSKINLVAFNNMRKDRKQLLARINNCLVKTSPSNLG